MFHCDHTPECTGPEEHIDLVERESFNTQIARLVRERNSAMEAAERFLLRGEGAKSERYARKADRIEIRIARLR